MSFIHDEGQIGMGEVSLNLGALGLEVWVLEMPGVLKRALSPA